MKRINNIKNDIFYTIIHFLRTSIVFILCIHLLTDILSATSKNDLSYDHLTGQDLHISDSTTLDVNMTFSLYTNIDTDGDTIEDNIDLDDDNDGILDTNEGLVCKINPVSKKINQGNKKPSAINEICKGKDTDNDGIADHLDLDSDNDGIPDNVEAQTTTGYIPPNRIVDTEGIDTAYPGGLTPIDTDHDKIKDFLDLDSDNDNKFDSTESGLIFTDSVGINGLDNFIDTADTYVDVNGKINTPKDDLSDEDQASDNDADVDYRDRDRDIPIAPEVTKIDKTKVKGTRPTSVLSKDNTPTINGICQTYLTVTVYIDGESISPSAKCTQQGTFSMIPDTEILDGKYSITATQADKHNNTSPMSPIDILHIDTTKPVKPTIVIIEDKNNDENISKVIELKGKIDVNITVPTHTKVGDILTIRHSNGMVNTISVKEEKYVYSIAYPVPDDNTTITVSATLTDKAGNISDTASDTATIINDLIPDYDIDILLTKTTIENNLTPFEIIITMSEVNYGTNSGDLIFSLTKNVNLDLNFDNTLTTLHDTVLDNEEWEMLTETDTMYRFKYIGNNGYYKKHTRMFIGFTGTFTPPKNRRGKFIINTRIKHGSGDSNLINNKDSDDLIFSKVK